MRGMALIALTPLAFAAACGGGSDGAGNGGTLPPPTGMTIDRNNAMQATAASYDAATQSGGYASLAGANGITADAGGGRAKPAIAAAGRAFDRLLQKIPFGPDSYPCAVAGTVTFSGNIADPVVLASGMLSPGDIFLVVYAGCDDGTGEIIDGTIDMRVDAFDGDVLTGAYVLTMSMDVTDFQVATATDTLLGNGDATATLDTEAAPYVEASVSGDSMTTDTDTHSDTVTVYASAQTLDARVSPSPYTMRASGTLDSTRLAGVVTYSTPVVFAGFDDEYPGTGELLVEGENSSARLVAIDNVNVRIEIDADGDGTVDDTILTAWAELAAL